jgi:hypothetical protein
MCIMVRGVSRGVASSCLGVVDGSGPGVVVVQD